MTQGWYVWQNACIVSYVLSATEMSSSHDHVRDRGLWLIHSEGNVIRLWEQANLCLVGRMGCHVAGFFARSLPSHTRASSIHVICRSVHIVPTRQLLKDVPQQPGAMYQTYHLADKSTYRLRVRTPSQEWWNTRSWSSSLQSVVAKGHRCG